LHCKCCGQRLDRTNFVAFLKTPTAKTNLGDACCDDCWDPSKGHLKCTKCGERRERDFFVAFLKTPTAKSNLGDACCDDCWNPTKGSWTKESTT
jgi:hypothetical protein